MFPLAVSLLASTGFGYTYSRYSGGFSWFYIAIPIVVVIVSAIVGALRRQGRRNTGGGGLSQFVGQPMSTGCPGCGAVNLPNAPRCAQCGRPLAHQDPVPAPPGSAPPGAMGLAGVAAASAGQEMKPFPRSRAEVEANPGPGPLRTVTHDVEIDGQVAFRQGELVEVEGISPDPARPDYRYVVLSRSLNQRFRLSDGDLSH